MAVSPKPDWNEPINIYSIAVLPPGSNKSTILNACTSPLVTWERQQRDEIKPLIDKALSKHKSIEKLIEGKRIKLAGIKDKHNRQLFRK